MAAMSGHDSIRCGGQLQLLIEGVASMHATASVKFTRG
jgi:hypothetical protein